MIVREDALIKIYNKFIFPEYYNYRPSARGSHKKIVHKMDLIKTNLQ